MNRKLVIALVLVIGLLPLQAFGQAAPVQAAASATLPPLVWKIVNVDTDGDVGQYAALALQPGTGLPYISYYDASNFRLKVANPEPGHNCLGAGPDWQCQVPSNFGKHIGQYSALAFQTNADFPGLAFFNATDNRVAFTGLQFGIVFDVSAVDYGVPGGISGWHNSLKFDSQGAAHLAYDNPLPISTLRYATYASYNAGLCGDGGAWNCYTIESGPGVGAFASLDLNGFDAPYIAYGGPNGELKLAHQVGSGGNCGPSNTWQCDVIDADVSVKYISLHISKCLLLCPDENQIAYHDAGGQRLKYAHLVGNGNGNCGPSNSWKCEVIETTGTAGLGEAMGVSLATYQGEPTIAFYDDDDTNHGMLKIARRSFSGNCGPFVLGAHTWQCEVVDDGMVSQFVGHDVGQYASLAMDPLSGRATIAYHDATTGDLRVALQQFQVFVPIVVR